MAQVFPFRALRYDWNRQPLPSLVTQPYDKITPAMQARYYDANPYNLVRVILGRPQPGDDDRNNVYTRAADDLRRWRAEGVLIQEPEPAIYRYSQRFDVPGQPGRVLERSGFIALGQLEDYDRGIVFRHELTHTGPKADRLSLLRTTACHCEQLFMIYSDPQRRIDALLASPRAADAEITDEYGVIHRIWRITEPRVLAEVTSLMADKKLVIADGHHRYETALTYRNERRAQAANRLGTAAGATGGAETRHAASSDAATAPYERVMMTFVNMDAEGLCILPTHRVVHSLPNFQSGVFVEGTRQNFSFEQMPGSPNAPEILRWLQENHENHVGAAVSAVPASRSDASRPIVMVAVTRHGAWKMRFRPETAQHLIGELSPRQQQLDVVVLHRVVIETMLGISPEDVRSLKHVGYYRDAQEAIDLVRAGKANAAFLINPVSVEQTRDIALAGEVMPQKSTDFYPKLLSGLTLYALD